MSEFTQSDSYQVIWLVRRLFRSLAHKSDELLEGFGISDNDSDLVVPSGAVIEYLNETQKTALGHIRRLAAIRHGRYLYLDETTVRSLELVRTLRGESRENGEKHHGCDAETGARIRHHRCTGAVARASRSAR